MTIKPGEAIKSNYNKISEMCKRLKEPIYLTKNGEGDLVVMDIETFEKREKMLEIREKLLIVEADKMLDKKEIQIEESDEI